MSVLNYSYIIQKIAQTDGHKWVEDEDSYSLNEDQYFPIENVYIPRPKHNRVYPDTVNEYFSGSSSPAVRGQTTSYALSDNDKYWQKLVDGPTNNDYSILLVDDGVHRSTAAKMRGDKWIRATDNTRGTFHGGVPASEFEGGLNKQAQIINERLRQIPSFEEVWEVLKYEDEMSYTVEQYVNYYTDNYIHDIIRQDASLSVEEEEQAVEDFLESNYSQDENYLNYIEETVIKPELEQKYHDIVYTYQNHLNGEKCYRAMTFPASINPLKHPRLGIYWAVEEGAEEAHWGKNHKGGSVPVTYVAEIDLDMVNWHETIYARIDWSLGELEKEIRFFKNSPIFVYGCYINNKYYEINDWRRT